MQRTLYIAKTDINTDGRILNQIEILQRNFNKLKIDFILFPDKKRTISLGENVKFHEIKTNIRNSKILRVFTVFDFTYKAINHLVKLKPKVIHVQDSAVILPCLLYKYYKGNKVKLIYDDHEIPNEDDGFFQKIFNWLEVLLMKKAENVIFANKERMDILQEQHSLSNKCSYFLNLPYFENENESLLDKHNVNELIKIDRLITEGIKFIIHQGVLEKERGRDKLANFSENLPKDYKILLLGGNEKDYLAFIEEYKLNTNNFYFRGSVNYLYLSEYWSRGIASIIMYLPNYINNKLCAPNRFFISFQKGLPVVVNEENPVLKNFVNKYECGLFIDDLNKVNLEDRIASVSVLNKVFSELKNEQMNNFIDIYKATMLNIK